MNHNISPFETPDYPPSSGMSELDSLSDSDWLDIASSRESDDNDSVISGDSDQDEVGLMPLSRRSSISVGSSRDGDVEAWEGFVDDSGDEDVRKNETGILSLIGNASEPEAATPPGPDNEHDLVEEQRVKEALDQSLISTLSASRSSSASTHNSIRDLRLSFPDPLTSSHDELHRSYDDVSPSETTFTATDVATDDVAGAGDIITMLPSTPASKEDPGSFFTTPEVLPHDTQPLSLINKAEFEVVLYGAESSIKWFFVEDLVRKAVAMSGRSLSGITFSITDSSGFLHVERQFDECLRISEAIPVYDRTGDLLTRLDVRDPQAIIKRPSLAVVYLPSVLNTLPDHTLYLPVFVAPTGSEGRDELARITAQDDWDSLCIPTSKTACLNEDLGSPIFDSRNVDQIQYLRAHQVLQTLVTQGKKRPIKSISEHLSSVHAVTLFALMSLIVGFSINTAFRTTSTTPTPTTGTPTSSGTLWGIFGPEVNKTSVFATTARANAPVAATSPKDFSLSVINPGTTSLAITSRDRPVVATISAPPKVESIDARPSPRAEKIRSAQDVIVRPTTQLPSIEAKPSMSVASHSGKVGGPSTGKSTGLSLRVVDSLSEVLDDRVKSLAKAVRSDLDELVESLDDLAQAIRRQSQTTLQRSKGKAKAIRERVHYRNDKARGKAKELKKKGEELILFAGEKLRGRTSIARKRARDIGQSLVASEAWRGYRKVHADWVAKLRDKGARGERVRSRRRSRCVKRSSGNVRRPGPRFLSCA